MSTRDYEGWRRYGKWVKENHKNYQKQMSDGKTEALKGTYFTDKKPKKMQKLERIPDPDDHQKLSFIKSGIRIVGYLCLPFSIIAATLLLVASEIVGIFEELV